ncbi:hypothetical protein ROZALSC1DRAFT_23986, partial [Rozella allomycis CSF55]
SKYLFEVVNVLGGMGALSRILSLIVTLSKIVGAFNLYDDDIEQSDIDWVVSERNGYYRWLARNIESTTPENIVRRYSLFGHTPLGEHLSKEFYSGDPHAILSVLESNNMSAMLTRHPPSIEILRKLFPGVKNEDKFPAIIRKFDENSFDPQIVEFDTFKEAVKHYKSINSKLAGHVWLKALHTEGVYLPILKGVISSISNINLEALSKQFVNELIDSYNEETPTNSYFERIFLGHVHLSRESVKRAYTKLCNEINTGKLSLKLVELLLKHSHLHALEIKFRCEIKETEDSLQSDLIVTHNAQSDQGYKQALVDLASSKIHEMKQNLFRELRESLSLESYSWDMVNTFPIFYYIRRNGSISDFYDALFLYLYQKYRKDKKKIGLTYAKIFSLLGNTGSRATREDYDRIESDAKLKIQVFKLAMKYSVRPHIYPDSELESFKIDYNIERKFKEYLQSHPKSKQIGRTLIDYESPIVKDIREEFLEKMLNAEDLNLTGKKRKCSEDQPSAINKKICNVSG